MLNKITTAIKGSPYWFIAILISIFCIVFFIYLPFQINLLTESPVRKVYYVDNISEAHLKIINKFNEKFRNKIEIVPVNLPFNNFTTNDRKEILTRSLRSRSDGIDIFAVDLIWIPRFAKWAYTMESSFSRQALDNVNKMALKACYHADSLVAFPMFLDLGVLYYRKDLLGKLPGGKELEKKIRNSLTWDEFIRLQKKFDPKVNPYYIFTGGNFEGMICCFHEMLSEKESGAIFNNRRIDLNTTPARRALSQLAGFVHEFKVSPSDVTRFDEYRSYIYANERNAVFLRGWVGYNKQYKSFLADTTTANSLAIAPMPHFRGNSTSSVFGGWSLMVSKFSANREEALKFIDFVFQKENQKILYEDGGYLPINDEVYKDEAYLIKHPELKQIRSLLSWAKHRPVLENYTQLSEIMARWFHKALTNEISVNEALSGASRQINDEKLYVK